MKKLDIIEKKLLHYTGKAIHHFRLIHSGDRVLVCLSGGKDSYTMLSILEKLRIRSHNQFSLHVLTLDQGHPGWNDEALRNWLTERRFSYTILNKDTYSIVKEKVPPGKTYCGLCSRLRRGIIYNYAAEHGYNKIALGHHRDDLNQTLLMSILYNGEIRSMPAKLLSDDKRNVVIRPLVFCQERDIQTFANHMDFPIIPCNLCGSQEKLARQRIKALLADLAKENPKIPSNVLHAIAHVKPSQLMDQDIWNFRDLEQGQLTEHTLTSSDKSILELSPDEEEIYEDDNQARIPITSILD